MDEWVTQQIRRLPKSILEYISSPVFKSETEAILRKFEISEEDQKEVRDEIYLFILGGMNPADFLTNLQLASLLDEEEAEKLYFEINDLLIDPIADELTEYWINEIGIDDEDDDSQDVGGIQTERVADPYREQATEIPLSKTLHKPGKTKTVTDKDLEEARRALSDPYREKIDK
jgi:hypothetical protein